MANEDYDLMPHKVINDLKGELKRLKSKSKPIGKGSPIDYDSIENLNASVHELLGLLKEASQDLKGESSEENQTINKLDDAVEKMDLLLDQNEKIAEGILTVANMIKELSKKTSDMNNSSQADSPQEPPQNSQMFGMPILGKQPAPAQMPIPQQPPSPLPNLNPIPQQPPSPLPNLNPIPQQPISSPIPETPAQSEPEPDLGIPPSLSGPPKAPAPEFPKPGMPGLPPASPLDNMPPPPAPPGPASPNALSAPPPKQGDHPGFFSKFK